MASTSEQRLDLPINHEQVEDSMVVLISSDDCDVLSRSEARERHLQSGGNQLQQVQVLNELPTSEKSADSIHSAGVSAGVCCGASQQTSGHHGRFKTTSGSNYEEIDHHNEEFKEPLDNLLM